MVWLVGDVPAGRADEPVAGVELSESPITSEDREHWSFQPLRRPEVPSITADQARNPIDVFVIARLRAEGLAPQPAAPPATLARRLSLDLTGLPPTDEMLALAEAPGGIDRLIDQLLASPAYGERWAQHWLDLARFAETDGFEHDKVREQAWQYRDWVIQALNRGMGYDEFVRQQLAGDVHDDRRALVATMFCTSGPDMPDINSQQERRHELLNEMTGTVGAVLLGLQIGCAQCHDHKYDPISQADFYRLRAVFEPAVRVQRNRSIGPLLEQPLESPARLWIRGDWRRPGPQLTAAAPRVANPRSTPVADRRQLAEWLTEPDHPLTARVIANRVWQRLFGQGLVTTPSDFGIMGDPPTHPQLLDYLACELIDGGWDLKRLQRLIVDSSAYRQRSRLDPEADQAATQAWQRTLEADPRNDLLSRFPRKRLGGEAVRDAMLWAGDALDRRMGGPGVRPPLPPDLAATLLKNQWEVSDPREHHRRSVYVFARRNLRFPVFEVLDRPQANASCPQRPRSTTAPQALLLLNSPLSLEAARRLAGVAAAAPTPEARVEAAVRRAWARAPSDTELRLALEFLTRQQQQLASRPPEQLTLPLPPSDLPGPAAAALTDLCLALINSNEFLYLD